MGQSPTDKRAEMRELIDRTNTKQESQNPNIENKSNRSLKENGEDTTT